jgi:hypothetical protein
MFWFQGSSSISTAFSYTVFPDGMMGSCLWQIYHLQSAKYPAE